MPALRLDSGEVLTEGATIVQYLSDQAPQKHLTPEKGTMDYYRTLEWLTFIGTELHKGFGPLFNPALPEAEKTKVVEKLQKRYAYIESALAGKEYLASSFTIADAYCYTILRWNPRAGIDLAKYPNISAFMARVAARPAVKQALAEEGLS